MKTVKEFFIKYMALIVLLIALVALFAPQSALWISTSWINYLLMVVMFGMGITFPAQYWLKYTDTGTIKYNLLKPVHNTEKLKKSLIFTETFLYFFTE